MLDNFATVSEAVEELKKQTFRIDAPDMPNGSASTLHMAITDETGNSAVLEYIDGNLIIHEGMPRIVSVFRIKMLIRNRPAISK